MDKIWENSQRIIQAIKTDYIRDFISAIDWDNRLIGVKGARGVGKTTLLLQYIKLYTTLSDTIYVSLDNIYFSNNILTDFVDDFVKQGGKLIVLDEVHRYSNWSIEIKNIYDSYPELKIIITGSSIIHLDNNKADLSRRIVFYEMPGLSFREYINISTQQQLPVYTLHNIIENHVEISTEILKVIKPLPHFKEYLEYGYYPFYLENKASYHSKIQEILNVVMEVDIPHSFDMTIPNIEKLKQLLFIIATSVPFKPNISKLSEKIGITRNTILSYLHYLNRAKIIHLLESDTHGVSLLQKPDKIYLHHPNIMYALAQQESDIGTIRETFFYNQLSCKHKANSTKHADFLIDLKYTFEIGGKNKGRKQIVGIDNAFVVQDSIEYGRGKTIPLWLFGFLY